MAERGKPGPLRAVVDGAVAVAPADDEGADEGYRKGGGDPLPAGFPIVALGVAGENCYYLDGLNQIRELSPRAHSRNGIVQLYGPHQNLLVEYYPRWKVKTDEDGNVVEKILIGFRPEQATDALMGAAARKGVWNPSERVRGCGAWLRNDGGLAYHSGDGILLAGGKRARDKWREPGLIDEFVYPAAAPILRPWPTAVPGEPAATVMELFGSWNWRHKACDPRLLLGWLGAAMIAGAVDWRPVVWITGGPGTGKSTLHRVLKGMLGGAILAVADASAAGIWQRTGFSSLPVALDELEPGEDDRRAQGILRLIRTAASGSMLLRGGADHTGAEFTLRSCFMASSVLVPPLSKADRSRIAILELLDLDKDETPPDMRPDRLRDLGSKLLRRLVDGWARWNDTLALYRAALARKGYGARGADVFGTLLAAADLLLDDAELNADFADEKVDEVTTLAIAGDDDMSADEDRCLQHLLTSLLPPDGPGRRSVGRWVGDACDGDRDAAGAAQDMLRTYGMKTEPGDDGRRYFVVANSHQGLARLFQGTHWGSRSGTTSVWKQSLARIPGAQASAGVVRFDKASVGRATLIPIEHVYHPDPAERAAGAAQRDLLIDE